MIRKFLVAALLLLPAVQQSEPTVRIGLGQNAATVLVRSTEEFRVQGQPTRTARFSPVLAVDGAADGTVIARDQLRYRLAVELDGNRYLVFPISTHIRIQPPSTIGTARLQFNDRSYRGVIEVFGNARNTLTVVNELPLEDYLLGVVPNELSPTTFGQLEALKAQSVAARTYIVKNMGQYRAEGYDICDTDQCQVYFGAGTEDPLSSRAVAETRGMVATYNGQPINALYSSTCGGRTEASENIFEERLPYLVSVICTYKHPEPRPFTARRFTDFKTAVLTVAGVSNYSELRRFLGVPGTGEPPSANLPQLAKYLRENFYPNVKTPSDLDFLVEQDILPSTGTVNRNEVLYRMIDRKSAFEWQQGVLVSWDGQTLTLAVGGRPTAFRLSPDAPVFFRMGEERTSITQGGWIGGELFDFRAVNGVIQMAVYRRNFVNATADRYSRLALWQVHKTKQEIETAFRPLNIGEIRGIRVIQRGPSERPLSTEVTGANGRTTVRALRLRSLLGLRDSMFYFDEERNAQGVLVGMTFYGSGWGHGVGMCQVGAFGMAMDGASYEEILKTYYTGIEVRKMY